METLKPNFKKERKCIYFLTGKTLQQREKIFSIKGSVVHPVRGCEMTLIKAHASVMKHCSAVGQGRIHRGCIPSPTSYFQQCFCKPYALRTHKSKMCEQNASYSHLMKHIKIRRKTLPKKCSNSTKMAIAICEFSKNFWGGMSPDSPRAFFVHQFASNKFCRK